MVFNIILALIAILSASVDGQKVAGCSMEIIVTPSLTYSLSKKFYDETMGNDGKIRRKILQVVSEHLEFANDLLANYRFIQDTRTGSKETLKLYAKTIKVLDRNNCKFQDLGL